MKRLKESMSSPSSAISPNKSFHPPLLPPMRNGTSIMTSLSMLQVGHLTVSGFDDFCDVCTSVTYERTIIRRLCEACLRNRPGYSRLFSDLLDILNDLAPNWYTLSPVPFPSRMPLFAVD